MLSDANDPFIAERARFNTGYSMSKVLTKSFTDGILKVHDCKGHDIHFQYELYEDFCRLRCQRSCLISLSQTCQKLHAMVEPILWKMVEFDPDNETLSEDLMALLCTLLKRPDLASSVGSFSFQWD